jgi:hypothetical protein
MLSYTTRLLGALVLTCSTSVLQSSLSWACSCYPNGSLVQVVPPNGATDVPIDVVPWVRARENLHLVDPDGNEVDVVEERHSARVDLSIFTRELRPPAPLLPNTTYRVIVDPTPNSHPPSVLESSFTTGTSSLSAPAWQSINLDSRVFDAASHLNTCVHSNNQACLYTQFSDELIDVRVLSGDERTIHYVDFASNLRNIELDEDATCLEVRARNLAGETSPPARTCFDLDAIPVLSRNGEFTVFPDCDAADFDARLVPRDEGCAVVRGSGRRGKFLVTVLLLLGCTWVARRK